MTVKAHRRNTIARVLASSTALMTAVQRINVRVTTLRQQQDSLRDLRRAHAVISREGYGHALAAFLHTKDFQRIAPNFPAVETLGAVSVPPRDRRVQAGLSRLRALMAREELLVADQVSDAAAAISDALSAAAEQAESYKELIERLESRLSSGTVSDEALESTTVTAIGADMRDDILGHMIDLAKAIDIPSYDETDEALPEKIEGHLAAMITAVGPSTGAVVDGFTVTVDPARIGEEYIPTEGTLAEKGYTVEKVRALLDRTEELISALQDLASKRDAMVDKLNDVAEDVRSDDDAPAAATESLEDDEDAEGEGNTPPEGDDGRTEDDPFAIGDDDDVSPVTADDVDNQPGDDDDRIGDADVVTVPEDVPATLRRRANKKHATGMDLLFMEDDADSTEFPGSDTETTDKTTDGSAGKPDEMGDVAAEELDDESDQNTENNRAAIGAFLSVMSLVLQQATGAIANMVAIATEVAGLVDSDGDATTDTPMTEDEPDIDPDPAFD